MRQAWTVTPMGLKQNLRLVNVNFSYPQADNPALQDLNLEISAKSTVGLVGHTGAGKTTVVDIILGLLNPNQGLLQVDGAVISKDNLPAWQRTLGYVPQDIFLSDDTVSANIAFGIPQKDIDPEAVERAARIAELHDFVVNELAQGYDTMVGERGVNLSGGQRQLIGIARALYHNPDVLILDEATSALDNLTEMAVMQAVHNLSNKKTIILIAHRLSTVKNCDCIYMLDHGRLAGQGTYTELLHTNSIFRRMAAANE
jgi:ABC-type multidrug transport system fused ATPase/permease subunit